MIFPVKFREFQPVGSGKPIVSCYDTNNYSSIMGIRYNC